jgi:hypothetical protein
MKADLIGETIELGARLRPGFAEAKRRKIDLHFLSASGPRRRGQRHASRDQRDA